MIEKIVGRSHPFPGGKKTCCMKALFFGFASLPEDEGGIVIGDLQGIYLLHT